MEESKLYCSHCGALITTDDYEEVNGEIVCTDCYERFTTTCDRCGNVIWSSDSYVDEYTTLCHHCYGENEKSCGATVRSHSLSDYSALYQLPMFISSYRIQPALYRT